MPKMAKTRSAKQGKQTSNYLYTITDNLNDNGDHRDISENSVNSSGDVPNNPGPGTSKHAHTLPPSGDAATNLVTTNPSQTNLTRVVPPLAAQANVDSQAIFASGDNIVIPNTKMTTFYMQLPEELRNSIKGYGSSSNFNNAPYYPKFSGEPQDWNLFHSELDNYIIENDHIDVLT